MIGHNNEKFSKKSVAEFVGKLELIQYINCTNVEEVALVLDNEVIIQGYCCKIQGFLTGCIAFGADLEIKSKRISPEDREFDQIGFTDDTYEPDEEDMELESAWGGVY